MEEVDPNNDSLNFFAHSQGDEVWIKWVKPNLDSEKRAPGTLIAYLTSMEKFLTFVTSSKYNPK